MGRKVREGKKQEKGRSEIGEKKGRKRSVAGREITDQGTIMEKSARLREKR